MATEDMRESFDAEAEIKRLIEEHEATVARLQDEMAQSIKGATSQMEEMIKRYMSAAQPQPQPKPKPREAIAVWKELDGQKFLVMNEVAAQMHQDVLDKVANLLPELQKALPKQPVAPQRMLRPI